MYIYYSTDSPIVNIYRSTPQVTVGTANGQSQNPTGTGELNLPKLPYGFPVTGHIMPGFRHTLKGVGPLCDADCTVTFTRVVVIVRDSCGIPVLQDGASTPGHASENRPATIALSTEIGRASCTKQ